jgi:hypothetical protein
MHTHSATDIRGIEQETGMELAGYLSAGEPATTKIPIFVRPGRSPAELRRIIERLNLGGDLKQTGQPQTI